MKNLVLLLALTAVSFAGCRDDKHYVEPTSSDLTLNFKATFGSDQLKKGKVYHIGSYPVKFNTFTLFVTGVSLMNGTQETPLTDAEFLNFFPATSSSNLSDVPSFKFQSLPLGNYTGLKIGFGVRTDLNAKKPSDFPAGSPLALETEYWAGWKSYIFSKIEADAEVITDNPNDYETFLTYHCGSAPIRDVFKSFTFEKNFYLDEFDRERTVELDLEKLFTDGSGNALNISKPSNQVTGTTTSDLPFADLLMSNWETAATVK